MDPTTNLPEPPVSTSPTKVPLPKNLLSLFVLGAALAVSVVGLGVRQLYFSKAAAGQLSTVRINPEGVATAPNTLNTPIYFSTLAFNDLGNPINTGIIYEWGISSNGSLGTLAIDSNGKTAKFIPIASGLGNLWVIARDGVTQVTKSVPLCIGQPCPNNTGSSPTPTTVPTPTPTPVSSPSPTPTPTPKPTPVPTPTPPPGCYYQSVRCVQAPCNPILVCPTSTPTPTFVPAPRPTPTSVPKTRVHRFINYFQSIFNRTEIRFFKW